jgi:uncharacterized protein YggE
MKRIFGVVLLLFGSYSLSQDIQVNRQNKTIAVTAEQSVSVDAEVAVVSIGYHNYAPTQDAAFQENVRVAGIIVSSMLGAGIPKANIETQKLHLGRTDPDTKWTPELKKDRQFEAQQSWNMTLPVSQAQAVVDLAVKNGANEVEDVEWDVADPVALQAKASGAALAKAREVADQMAKGLGAKLGDLVYASNRAPVQKEWRGMEPVTVNAEMIMNMPTEERKPRLTLFPQKVKSDATVYAVFAIE